MTNSSTQGALLYREWRSTHDPLRQGHRWRPNRQQGNCRECWAEIVWVCTEKGKLMPLDPDISPSGRFCVRGDYRDAGGRRVVHYVGISEMMTNQRPLYQSHFDTCSAKMVSREERQSEG
jgi:hypothetical protein